MGCTQITLPELLRHREDAGFVELMLLHGCFGLRE